MSEPLPPLTPDTAAQIARQDPVLSQNTEPGFANTYGPGSNIPEGRLSLAIPAGLMSAAGLYWLYRKYQQDKLEKEKQAAVDWQAVRAQLPGLHAPDLLLGGAAGAGAGMLYDYLRGSEKKKRFATALRRILTGAALGAGVTNLVGDRFRRYVTNSVVPAGYDGGNIISQLKPRSWQHVYDAAIKDKPSYDPAKVKEFIETFQNTEVGSRVLTARREIERIGQGINLYDPNTSVWQRNPDKTYSLNEKNKNYARNLAAIYLPARLSAHSLYRKDDPQYLAATGLSKDDAAKLWAIEAKLRADTQSPPYEISSLFFNPKETMDRDVNSGLAAAQTRADLFGSHSLLGAQQLITRANGQDVDGQIVDRHDVTPSRADTKLVADAIWRGKIFDSNWRNQKPGGGYTSGQTNAQIAKTTLGRLFWDRILRSENPWVAQKFKFTPTAPQYRSNPDVPEYGLQFLKQDGAAVTPVLDRQLLSAHLLDLQRGNFLPPEVAPK